MTWLTPSAGSLTGLWDWNLWTVIFWSHGLDAHVDVSLGSAGGQKLHILFVIIMKSIPVVFQI